MNIFIIFAASYLYLIVIAISISVFLMVAKKKKIEFIKLTLLSSAGALLIAKIGSYIINSPRPYLVEHIQPLIHASADNGFPSDHTLLSMTFASVVFAFNKKLGIVLAIFALIVGIGRVLAHVHHPIDIIGSIIISIIVVYMVWNILRWLKVHSSRK